MSDFDRKLQKEFQDRYREQLKFCDVLREENSKLKIELDYERAGNKLHYAPMLEKLQVENERLKAALAEANSIENLCHIPKRIAEERAAMKAQLAEAAALIADMLEPCSRLSEPCPSMWCSMARAFLAKVKETK